MADQKGEHRRENLVQRVAVICKKTTALHRAFDKLVDESAYSDRGIVMVYYAHVRHDCGGEDVYQTVAEHLTGTAALCREFAEEFGAGADGELVGLLHDLGKCTQAFQKRLLRDGPVVDHATAGALACVVKERENFCAAACVTGHHGGLQDFENIKTDRADDATLCGRLKKGIREKYLEHCGESGVSLTSDFLSAAPDPYQDPLTASFWTRMLYSCLVDADFLDTERFMQSERERGRGENLEVLLLKLQVYIARWQKPQTELNRLRGEILNTCLNSGSKAKGIYILTVPTGGGKTVASLAFALRHAVEHKMWHIIYVIPYTSIFL